MTAPTKAGAEQTGLSLDTEERELIRSLILADPELVLSDDMVMRALLGATAQGARNIVDLRDKLVERLETRLQKLVRTNRSVIAAAYENVAGTQQVHRAILALIDAPDADDFLHRLTQDVPAMVGVEEARLCIESDEVAPSASGGIRAAGGGRVLKLPVGLIDNYMALDDGSVPGPVSLRACGVEAEEIFGRGTSVRSEALLRLDIAGTPGLLAFGADDPDRFGPDQGVDLLTFFGSVVERLAARQLGGPAGG